MPDAPALNEVNSVLKNYLVFSNRADAFSMQLSQYMNGVGHENKEVRFQVNMPIYTMIHFYQLLLLFCPKLSLTF